MEQELACNLRLGDIIALVALGISIITLIWNIANSIIEKTARIKIRIGRCLDFSLIVGSDTPDKLKPSLTITVINISPFNLYITKPMFQGIRFRFFPVKFKGYEGLYLTKANENYPIYLKSRDQYATNVEVNETISQMLDNFGNKNKLRVRIMDTTGKKFYSNKISINELQIFKESFLV